MYISMWVELLIFKKVGGYPTHNIYIYSLSRNTRRNLNIFLEKYRRQKNESLTTLIADPAHLSIIKFPNMENGWTFFFKFPSVKKRLERTKRVLPFQTASKVCFFFKVSFYQKYFRLASLSYRAGLPVSSFTDDRLPDDANR